MQAVTKLLADRYNLDVKDAKPSDLLVDVGVDSLDKAEILLDMEEAQDVTIVLKREEQVKTLQDLDDLVVECAAAKPKDFIMAKAQ